jgi:hypothetical protein
MIHRLRRNIRLNMRSKARWVKWEGYWFLAGGRSIKPGQVWFQSCAFRRGFLGLKIFE